MRKTGRSRAEALFASSDRQAQHALKEKEKVRQEKAAHVAKLRAMRLAREEADKPADPKGAAGK
jgi:hypothetical protein